MKDPVSLHRSISDTEWPQARPASKKALRSGFSVALTRCNLTAADGHWKCWAFSLQEVEFSISFKFLFFFLLRNLKSINVCT